VALLSPNAKELQLPFVPWFPDTLTPCTHKTRRQPEPLLLYADDAGNTSNAFVYFIKLGTISQACWERSFPAGISNSRGHYSTAPSSQATVSASSTCCNLKPIYLGTKSFFTFSVETFLLSLQHCSTFAIRLS
jgi:hypothetical protein